ncbi:phage tail protein [Xenorhabdus sp. KK7.4]|uniref:phage tail protein n=1 Tax=Xenorhabdus sp. KK7.4 TaxID=1851572 RepID=UPI000C03A6BD|nr:phage tail protein [Xenorhabdus sp. KK7.4]PHM51743.1 phage tail fiber protein [Xenorhabdus sp. KK7.4]
MSKYFALLTRLGADRLANAAALGTKIEITHMAVGDGGGKLPMPDANQKKLVNEKRRAAINVLSVDPKNTHQIIAEQVIPEHEGGWWIREIGLFDKHGVLMAVANCAETYKPQLQEGSGRTQTIRMVLIVSHTNAVTLKIDPSVVLATREYADAVVAKTISDHEKSRRHPDATLKEKGFVSLSNATDSNSEAQAATPKAVKTAYEWATTANNNANSRLEKSRVVQKTGAASDHVMSQRAATEAFARRDLFTAAGNISAILTPTKHGSLVVADGKHGPFLSLQDEQTGEITFSVDSAGNIGQGLVLVQSGGTGAKTAEQARTNLNIYSRDEINQLLGGKQDTGNFARGDLFTGAGASSAMKTPAKWPCWRLVMVDGYP